MLVHDAHGCDRRADTFRVLRDKLAQRFAAVADATNGQLPLLGPPRAGRAMECDTQLVARRCVRARPCGTIIVPSALNLQ